MGIEEKVYAGGFQEVYDKIGMKLENRENSNKQDVEDYDEAREYLGRELLEKEKAIEERKEEMYVKGLVFRFFKGARKEISPRFYLFMLGSEIDSLIDFLGYRVEFGGGLRVNELIELYTLLHEIEILNKVYGLNIERVFKDIMTKELGNWLLEVGLGKKRVVIESTVNIYKTVLYGHSLVYIGDIEEYEMSWVKSKGFNGDLEKESEEGIVRLAALVVQFVEGIERSIPKEEEKLVERFEKILINREWKTKEGMDIPIRVYSLDGKGKQVFLIGNRYEITIRKRFVVHRYGREMLQRVRGGLVIYSNSVHDMRVRDLERIIDNIVFDLENR